MFCWKTPHFDLNSFSHSCVNQQSSTTRSWPCFSWDDNHQAIGWCEGMDWEINFKNRPLVCCYISPQARAPCSLCSWTSCLHTSCHFVLVWFSTPVAGLLTLIHCHVFFHPLSWWSSLCSSNILLLLLIFSCNSVSSPSALCVHPLLFPQP